MNARLAKFPLIATCILMSVAAIALAGQAFRPATALAEGPPPPPTGLPQLPPPPADPEAEEEAPPTGHFDPAPPQDTTPQSAAPAEVQATGPVTKQVKVKKHAKKRHARCKHRRCARHTTHGRQARGARASSVTVGGIAAGSTAYFSTCNGHLVYGTAWNLSGLQGNGVWAIPEVYDYSTGRWAWAESGWIQADGLSNYWTTAYHPYSYAYMLYARYSNGWKYAAEWRGIEADLDNGFCS